MRSCFMTVEFMNVQGGSRHEAACQGGTTTAGKAAAVLACASPSFRIHPAACRKTALQVCLCWSYHYVSSSKAERLYLRPKPSHISSSMPSSMPQKSFTGVPFPQHIMYSHVVSSSKAERLYFRPRPSCIFSSMLQNRSACVPFRSAYHGRIFPKWQRSYLLDFRPRLSCMFASMQPKSTACIRCATLSSNCIFEHFPVSARSAITGVLCKSCMYHTLKFAYSGDTSLSFRQLGSSEISDCFRTVLRYVVSCYSLVCGSTGLGVLERFFQTQQIMVSLRTENYDTILSFVSKHL